MKVLTSYLERVLVDLGHQRNGGKIMTGKSNGRDKDEEGDDFYNNNQIPSSSSSATSFTTSFTNTFTPKILSSSSPDVTYGTNSSTHGGLNMGLNSSHGKAEEAYSTLMAGLVGTPDCMREKGNDVKLFYALSEKIVAAESCSFAALVRTYIYLSRRLNRGPPYAGGVSWGGVESDK